MESEITVFAGGKLTLLFPFGWQIAIQMGWSRGKRKEGLFWGWRFSGIRFWDATGGYTKSCF